MNSVNLNYQVYNQTQTKHATKYPSAASGIVSFGNKGLQRAVSKTSHSLRMNLKFPKLKIKLADLSKRCSVYFFKLSEKLSKGSKINESEKLVEQQNIIRILTKNLNFAFDKINNLKQNNEKKDGVISDLNNKLENLNEEKASVDTINKDLELKIQESKEQLRKTIEAHEKGEINPALIEKVKAEVLNTKLNYNPMEPFFVAKNPLYLPEYYKYDYENIRTETDNRSEMQDLVIPKITGGYLDFELPKGEMKVKKAKLKNFSEAFEVQSNISDKYNDSLVWNTDKVVRDLLQNFFDGHGQTLDGVRFIFKPSGFGKYKVRIEGKSTYNYKEAVLLGESSSHDDNKAAGNYGEGLKMVTLKLLMQNKTSNVKIGSGNWEVLCGLKKDKRLDSEVMNYQINPVENYDGNFIEFETTDKNFLEAIRTAINRFYHSSNTHFKCPNFENDLFGIKVLPKGEKGGLYITGQRFEYNGSYDGINGGVIFIKEKIPTEYYDTSRDRVSVTPSKFKDIAEWLRKRTKNPHEQMQIIKVLEPFVNKDNHPLETLLDEYVYSLGNTIRWHKFGAIKFPDKYVAKTGWFIDMSILRGIESNGYKVFSSNYIDLGMADIADLVTKAREHQPLEPTEDEETKIIILKRALNLLSNLMNNHFTPSELDTKVHIFNRKSKKENSIDNYDSTLAEAIIDYKESKGFWIDRTYLSNAKFSHVLETALHELSHKAGGDGSKEFGYKLTDVNQEAFTQIIKNPKIAEELRILDSIWEELNSNK